MHTDYLPAGVDMSVPPLVMVAAPAVPPRLPAKPKPRVRKRYLALLLLLLFLLALPVLCVVEVTSYFRLSSETAALGGSLMKSLDGPWHKRFGLNVGGATFGLVRGGASFVHLPPEAAAGIKAVRSAEVAVYERECHPLPVTPAAVLMAADRAMQSQGWQRIVGMAQDHQLVAIYLPRKGGRPGSVKCCLAVLQDRQLVLVSARGNIQPLVALADQKLDLSRFRQPPR